MHGALCRPRPEGRAQAAQGVVGISFRTNDLVRSVLPEKLARDRRIVVTDPQARSEGANDLLFDSAWVETASPTESTRSDPWRSRVQVAGRSWDVEVRSLGPAWAIDKSTWWLLALGLALSAALAAMTRILVHANIVADARIRLATRAHRGREGKPAAQRDALNRMLFTHSLDGVMRTLPGGAILAANAAACAMYGRSEAELQTLAHDELIDMNDPRVAPMEAQCLATGSWQGAIRMRPRRRQHLRGRGGHQHLRRARIRRTKCVECHRARHYPSASA